MSLQEVAPDLGSARHLNACLLRQCGMRSGTAADGWKKISPTTIVLELVSLRGFQVWIDCGSENVGALVIDGSKVEQGGGSAEFAAPVWERPTLRRYPRARYVAVRTHLLNAATRSNPEIFRSGGTLAEDQRKRGPQTAHEVRPNVIHIFHSNSGAVE